jgi:hypothetical protein
MALCAVVVAVLALPISNWAAADKSVPLNRTKAYEVASHVVEGQVKSLQRIDRDGNPASSGPRFSLELEVSKVHKTLQKEPVPSGNTVSVLGWVTGKQKTYLPKEKEEVLAFLKRKKNGGYEALEQDGVKPLRKSAKMKKKK